MYYAVGTHIDLGHLNSKPATARTEAPVRRLFPVGTQIIFRYIDGICQPSIRIPVTAV